MIPRTFPSSVASNGSTQMIVYFLPSVAGLTRWVDYIPVKFTTVATAATENTYNQNGYIPVVSISSIAGATPFKEYVPVFLDSSAVDADVWDVNITGFIPVGTAGIGGAALYMDFAATTTLDPRVTFSRTTNATLTNSAGLVANAPMNLLTFSEQFDNAAWIKGNATITANSIAAPNGTLTADKLVETIAPSVSHAVLFSFTPVSGTVYAYSMYAKAGERGFIQLAVAFGAQVDSVYFNLQTGVVGTASGATGTIQAVGNGWFRCTMLFTAGSSSSGFIVARTASADGNNTYTSDGISGIYIWGAQLELGSTATTYNPTTVKNLLGFTEHFDNAAWTKSNAFVQTNLLTYSQDFDNAAWNKVRAFIVPNDAIAPDGTLSGDKTVPNFGAQFAPHAFQLTSTAAQSYTYSVYAKAAEWSFVQLCFSAGAATGAFFNLSTGSVGIVDSGYTASITPAGNGWWRCAVTVTSTGTPLYTFACPSTGNGVQNVTGDGTSGIYLWGAQLVQGTSAGDYKATYAAAAAVGYTDIYGQPFAQKMVENTANAGHFVNQGAGSTGAVEILSVYAKAAERTWLYLAFGAGASVYFDLANGVVGTVSGGTAAIASIGNGWFRCSITATRGANFNNLIASATSNGTVNYTGDGNSGIYIFGAQLSDSASVDPYVYQPVAAPSSVAYYGPRFDYDPVTLAPKGLLIEEQRTNLVPYSEQFDNASWGKQNSSVTANATTAPDGTSTADTLVENTSNAVHNIRYFNYTVLASTTYVASVFVKANGRSIVYIDMTRPGVTNHRTWFDLSGAGSVLTSDAGNTGAITSVGNGWYRISVTRTTASGQIGQTFEFGPATADNTVTYTGNGTSGVFLWGAQVEAGAFATSYIPTVASQVTRAADSASMIGNNFARWYTQGVGTIFSQFDTPASGNRPVVSIDDNTANNMIRLRTEATDPYFRVVTGGAAQADLDVGTVAANTIYKMAGGFGSNSFLSCINAGTVGSDTSGTVPTVDRLRIGSDQAGAYLNGHIARTAYYGRVLTATEDQGITQ